MHQCSVFCPALAQNVAYPVQHSLRGGEVIALLVLLKLHIGRCFVQRHPHRVGKQRIGQRLQAGFTGDLALGAALLLVGQVQIFQVLFGGGLLQGGAQFGRQLALFVNAFQHGLAPLSQLAQVTQPVLKFTQLNVVQAAGSLFAVTGNKRHGCAAVQQLHCRFDLVVLYFDFEGDLANDGLHGDLMWSACGCAN